MDIRDIVSKAHQRGAQAGQALILSSSLDLEKQAEQLLAQARAEARAAALEEAAHVAKNYWLELDELDRGVGTIAAICNSIADKICALIEESP